MWLLGEWNSKVDQKHLKTPQRCTYLQGVGSVVVRKLLGPKLLDLTLPGEHDT